MLASIFNDVIGPVMRGPSSSHCAAALRIGRLARDLTGGAFEEVLIEFDRNGSLPTTHDSQGSDMGLGGGLMGWEADDERLPDSMQTLRETGVRIRIETVDAGDPHPNTYRLTLRNGHETRFLRAISTGGGMIEVLNVDAFDVSVSGDCFETLLWVRSQGPELARRLAALMHANAVSSARLMSEPVDVGEGGSVGGAIVGNSRVMQEVCKEIGRVAAKPVAVLIRGATGTGKELVARALYQHSTRADKPFIAVNCAAIPETLLESELFGHERGAFTGAESRRVGRFEQADGGTLFLDEIGDMTAFTQAKLLRVLQEKCIQRVGGKDNIPVDVRIIAATHRDLETAIRENHFREDLFYRLSSFVIHLPPLRSRLEDIPDLATYFLRRFAVELQLNSAAIQPEAVGWLQQQNWPGNVRQLANVLRQALLLTRDFPISVDHLKAVLLKRSDPLAASQQTLSAFIEEFLDAARQGTIADAHAAILEAVERQLSRTPSNWPRATRPRPPAG